MIPKRAARSARKTIVGALIGLVSALIVVAAIAFARRSPTPGRNDHPAAPSTPLVAPNAASTSPSGQGKSEPSPAAATTSPVSRADTTPSTPSATERENARPSDSAQAAAYQPTPPPTEEKPAAKTLFYADTKPGESATVNVPNAAAAATGLKYTVIQRSPSGDERDVDPDTTFHSGDRVRFAFESNVDGYLYVVQQGSSGKWTVLFPNPQINGGRNAIQRFQRYLFPSQTWLLFNDTPGTEQILVIVSKQPLEELPGGTTPVTPLEPVDGSVVDTLNRALKPRDLVFERDRSTAQVTQTYVVNRDESGRAVTTTIRLVHSQ